jgi:predicted AlkP superfamily phosphohydrolase/phosphomutase
MGTPDMFGSGSYGTYQYFDEGGPKEPESQSGGRWSSLVFEAETAQARLLGPNDSFLRPPPPPHSPPQVGIDFLIHRDTQANGAVIEIQGQRILLSARAWSRWIKLDFSLSTPWFTPSMAVPNHASGICRFYLKEVAPNFRLYVSPVNFDPAAPATPISEPGSFVQDISRSLGSFYTTGFQEDYQARKNGVFLDDEFARQANMVLEERLRMFRYAVDNYDDGLLFFYFSSSDLQSHIFWWNSDDPHPFRDAEQAQRAFGHVHQLYQRLDREIGKILDDYGSQATIFVMSDHGFANFGRQFNLNRWLREASYLGPEDCRSIMQDVDWSRTSAYGLGINGLYLNMRGRERDGIVEAARKEELLRELVAQLEAVTDDENNNQQVIRKVYRADEVYGPGNATALAPDLIVGYARGYRASWGTTLGDIEEEPILSNNENAWSADHCADALEVPGVLFCNRPFRHRTPALVDIAPSILAEYGLPAQPGMVGRSIF